MRVTVPSPPIPRTTCLFFMDLAASSMLTRSVNLFTAKAPLLMSESIAPSMERMRSASGVDS